MSYPKSSGNTSDTSFGKVVNSAKILDPAKIVVLTVNPNLDKVSSSDDITAKSALVKKMFSDYRRIH